ncbi:YihY/virulence factor BrkB family protein [Hasllibacter sp. MH4015]|uniref:YihY/virulence factor BrkB family protein n=1 Tax=Hasllibacter sp. MH4015 TaxID=2854029 RepID=UPI001CD4B1A4|nr:YihY/virulence factor BrkB family protein [Hasllibacter sp. MH4015]
MSNTEIMKTAPHVGQAAIRPAEIPPRGYWQVAKRLFHRVTDNRIGLIAAGVAFYALLALFPAITALVAIGGVVIDPVTIAAEIEPLLASLPTSAADIMRGQLTELATSDEESLGWAAIFALLLALFSASRGTLNLIAGLNVAYEEYEERGLIRLHLTSLVLTLLAVIGVIVTLLIAGAIPIVVATLAGPGPGADLALLLRWPLLFIAAVLGFSALYKFGPSRRPAKWRWLTPGATLAVILWVAGTIGFSWYVQGFAAYNETFGALAGVIILLMWLWLTSFAILLGATFDAEIEAQTAKDSTIGPQRPMGERGAVKADSCDAKP